VHGDSRLVAFNQAPANQRGEVLEENHAAGGILMQNLVQPLFLKPEDLGGNQAFRRGRIRFVLHQTRPADKIAGVAGHISQELPLAQTQPYAPLAQNKKVAGGFTLPKDEISLRVRFLASAFQDPLASHFRDSFKEGSLHRRLLPQNSPLTFPVFTSTSTRRKPGLEDVPGIKLMAPAQGQRNFAPEYTSTSRMGSTQPSGTPLSAGSWLKLR
jgi:hypothetical protein